MVLVNDTFSGYRVSEARIYTKMTLFLVAPKKHWSSYPIKYLARDGKCLGRKCFLPGKRERKIIPLLHNINKLGRQRKDKTSPVCTTMYDKGCPKHARYSKKIYDERIAEGWKTAIM